ncbi:hypothetical protein EYF80_065651 [Liparis tanakae]|uniref:Uncharacterized protein n=1 Tax=Liparis tanakae TaxID=230148 RepID=A0A4Z2E5M9_9TELE|nr:hypothetical protein EYF80_065651 [Liparis tanakae]
MLMTLDSFCTRFSSRSPFLIVSWYCQFLLSGLRRRRRRRLCEEEEDYVEKTEEEKKEKKVM